jgi:hypothetical protein
MQTSIVMKTVKNAIFVERCHMDCHSNETAEGASYNSVVDPIDHGDEIEHR